MNEDGTVASVTYASNDPIDRALRSFGVDISGNPTLADLLKQLRRLQDLQITVELRVITVSETFFVNAVLSGVRVP